MTTMKSITDYSYKNYSKSLDIHGSVLYPAIMIAPVQRKLLEFTFSQEPINTVFDPFHGSGTSLYEAYKLDEEMQLFGCDINPLANLITKTKLQGVSSSIDLDIDTVENELLFGRKEIEIDFPFMNKWFSPEILKTLRRIKYAVRQIESRQNRLFFWTLLCDQIRRYSATSSSTYKLYEKDKTKKTKMENFLIRDYLVALKTFAPFYIHYPANYTLVKGDVLQYLIGLGNRKFDVVITSPPYGENATTVPYGQFSMLALHIIDKEDLELEGWELDNYSIIDQKSLGGEPSNKRLIQQEHRHYLQKELSLISPKKQGKVERFFVDYFKFLTLTCKITGKYLLLTLGNRTVDRITIDLNRITKDFLVDQGFKTVKTANRELIKKRIPKITSMVNKNPVTSINREYMTIYQRK